MIGLILALIIILVGVGVFYKRKQSNESSTTKLTLSTQTTLDTKKVDLSGFDQVNVSNQQGQIPNVMIPPPPSIPMVTGPALGYFQIVAKGETGSEQMSIVIDNNTYGPVPLKTQFNAYSIKTQNPVDLKNVSIILDSGNIKIGIVEINDFVSVRSKMKYLSASSDASTQLKQGLATVSGKIIFE